MALQKYPCVVYRGGTSRGIFFHKKDLPVDWEAAKRIFLTGMDAYNPSQTDGLGGTTSSTSKVVVMSPSARDDADVNYSFVQIGVGEPVADATGTCGNLMAGAGLFSVDEGMTPVDAAADEVTVRMYDTNINKVINVAIPLEKGVARTRGDYHMPGIIQKGPLIRVAIMNPGGGKTGRTLPLGITSGVTTEDGAFTVTFADIVNPLVFVEAEALGLSGTESSVSFAADQALIKRMMRIRDDVAVKIGMAASPETAYRESPANPRIVAVAPPQDYTTTSGERVRADEADVLVKVLSMGKLHRTSPASALYCIASACLLPGSIAHKVARKKNGVKDQVLRVGHPEGVVEVRASLTDDGRDVLSVGTDRTARRIMQGELCIPEE